MENSPSKSKAEHPLFNLLFNIVIPVLVLHKGTKYLGPAWALLVGLAFPIAYGSVDLYRKRKVNFFSLLGVLNVSLTGGLALSGLGGIWFAIKEAAFPLLIGVFVAASALSSKPFIQTLIVNPQTVHWDLVDAKLKELGRESEFLVLLRRATLLLAASFLVSAFLNFVLAVRVFVPIDPNLSDLDQAGVLNDQIAEMTSLGFAVTFVPSIVLLSAILFYLFRGMTKATGLSLDQIMR